MNELKLRVSDILSEILFNRFKNNKSAMIKYMGFSNTTSLTQYIEKNTNPQIDFVYGICNSLGINPTWLILGEGKPMLSDIETKFSQKVTSGDNSNITQIMHSNDILAHENEALKRENTLLREMIDLYKKNSEN